MALFRKLFYRKPPDGLFEICERVYVFDKCFTTDALEEHDYKGYMGRIISQLKEHYPDASILAFNFREGETQSQIANAMSEYDMTVMEYPRQYEGCPLLPMEMIHHFLRSSESWLSLGMQNVLFMHCECGGWPILAFMLAALLIYRKYYSGEMRTLDMVYKQAPREVLQLYSPLNPVPSQLRYLQYVSRRNVATEWPPVDRALTLDCVIIRTIPNFDGEGGCQPIFRIYGQDPSHISNRAPKVLFSTPKKSKAVRRYKQSQSQLVKIDISCQIQGDVVMECINLHDNTEGEQMIFRVMFNTAFIRSNIIILNRDEIDILWDAKDQFLKDFRAEALFSEMDTAASEAPVDYFRYEEKDGLPVEAFGKVQEIFSGVDWPVPKGDAEQPHAEKSPKNQGLATTEYTDVVRKQSDPQDTPSGIGAILFPENKHIATGGHSPSSSTLAPEQHSDGKALYLASNQRSDSDAVQSDVAKDVFSSESETSKSKTSSSVVDVGKSSKTLSSAPSNDPQVIGDGALPPKASFPETDATFDTASHKPPHPPNLLTDPSITENSVSSSGPTPPAPPPPTSPIKANSTRGVEPSHTPPALDSTDGAANKSGAHPRPPPPPPSLMPPNKSSFVGVDTLPSPVPQPLPISPLKEDSNSKAVPLPPSTPPLRDTAAAKHALPPPPPPPPPPKPHTKSSSGERPHIPSHPMYVGQFAPPSLPPPPQDPHLRDTSAIRHASHPTPPPLGPANLSTSTPPPPRPLVPRNSTSAPPPPPPPAPRHSSTSAPPPPPPPGQTNSSTSAPPPPPLPGQTNSSTLAPPPPPTPGNSTSAPTPPPPAVPPPGTKGKARSILSKNSQEKKLKPLHWLKISRAVSGSLWAEAQKTGDVVKTPEIDMSELESLFSAAPNKAQGKKTGSQASKGQKSEKVQLIDHRRAYNCEIMLSKVKVPLPDMLNSVLALEDSALDADQVDNIIKFCPTKEEMEMLKGYKGEKDKLGKCEQFFLELMQVPRIEYKLRVFSFKIQFRSQVSELRNSLNVANSATDQIKGSAKLRRIMQTILSLGNALNQGTARGAAVGFRLDSLLKLTETRAQNNKMTLMHYLCKVLNDKLPELLDFWEDLSSLEPASRVQLKFLAEEMQAINKGLEKVVQELSISENDGPVSEKFRKALKEFLCSAEGEVRSLASLYSGVGRNVDSLILYFGEDPARCPYEQVVTTLSNFVRMFRKAHEENMKQQELEKKKAEKEASEKPKMNTTDSGQLLPPSA